LAPLRTLTYTRYRYGSFTPFQRCGLGTLVVCTKLKLAPGDMLCVLVSSVTRLPTASTMSLTTVKLRVDASSLLTSVVIFKSAELALTLVGVKYTPGVLTQYPTVGPTGLGEPSGGTNS